MGWFAALVLLGVAVAPSRSNIVAGLLVVLAGMSATTDYITAAGFVNWLTWNVIILVVFLGAGSALCFGRMISGIAKATP